jgi:REP element-mobilizing transposase RayT
MDEDESLSHSKWECKYHIVFIPKGRRRALYGELRRHLGEVFRRLAEQKESRVEEGHLMPDQVHMMLSIPPKYACRRWWGTSRARVRFIWHGYTGSASAISSGRVFGPADTLCQRWVGTRRSYANTSGIRSRRISVWSSSTCGDERPPTRRPKRNGAALATPHSRFERLTI